MYCLEEFLYKSLLMGRVKGLVNPEIHFQSFIKNIKFMMLLELKKVFNIKKIISVLNYKFII